MNGVNEAWGVVVRPTSWFAWRSAVAAALLGAGGGWFTRAPAAVHVVPGNLAPEQNARALKDTVAIATDGDVVYVRGGPYRFSPLAGAPHAKPLRIDKNIQLIADAGRVTLDGGAGVNFSGAYGAICDSCATVGYAENAAKCAWAKQDSANASALVAVNASSKTTDRRSWNVVLKNFTMQYSFRKGGYKHQKAGENCTPCDTHPDSILYFYPGAAVEAWFTSITIDSCDFRYNSTTRYAGRGGAVSTAASNVTVRNSLFEKNYGGYYGGALFASDGAMGSCSPCCDPDSFPHAVVRVRVLKNIFRENFGEFGGGFQIGSASCPTSNPNGYGIDSLVVRDNLVAENCVSRFAVNHHTAGSGIYIPAHATVVSLRHNTIAGNKNSDNTGALFFNYTNSVMTDSVRLNIIAKNRGGGIHLQCRSFKDKQCLGGSDYCVQNTLRQMEHNLFWDNKQCDGSGTDAHVIIGQGREIHVEPECPTQYLLQDWDCSKACSTTTNWRVRWCDDPVIASCASTTPCVETTNKVCDPGFTSSTPCPAKDYRLHCCSSALVLDFGSSGAHPGWNRSTCGDNGECPAALSVIASSMVHSVSPNPDPLYVNMHFKFSTDQQGDKFSVQWRFLGETGWPNSIACTGPGANCIYSFCKSYQANTVRECDPAGIIEWQAKAENCRGPGSWSATKRSNSPCIQP